MNAKKIFSKIIFAALFFAAFGASRIFAQPTDAQIRSRLSGPKVVSTVLHKPGKKVWSSSYSKYTWDIGFTNKVKDADNPGGFIYVDGVVSFDIIGGRCVFWKVFSGDVRYEGIANLNETDFQALIKQFGIEKIMGNSYDDLIGKIESISLASEPKFEWHTPNSVSFNFTATYTKKIDDIGGRERALRTFRIRLYRDDKKSAWNNNFTDLIDEKIL